ncbi:MAG: hypothetical protein KTR21_01170 [Rhodobacteraceae bacterium]|nr:hypothetical protein [Paracoccaceae bacterium]
MKIGCLTMAARQIGFALAATVGLLATNTALAQQPACIAYEHAGFKGDRLVLTEGQEYSRLNKWNDRISSIRVARGCEMKVGYRKKFDGRREVFSKDVEYLGARWNDVISAVSCTCQNANWRQRRQEEPRRRASSAACVVYDRRDFEGDRLEMNAGQVYQRLRRWNDRISSVRVREGCRLDFGVDWNFGGGQGSIDEDVRYVGGRLNNRLSALSCACNQQRSDRDRPRRDRNRPPELSRNGSACILYEDSGFKGAWRAFERGEEGRTLGRRLNQRVSSVKVAPGCVALLDVNRPYKLWVEQNISRLGRAQNDRSDSVSCFCPKAWR